MIWTLIRMYWRPLALAGVLLAAAAGIGWYGHTKYRAGQADARSEIAAQTRAIEIATQQERDRADANYRGRILATQMDQKALARRLANSDSMLRELRGKLQAAGACGRLDDSGEDWIGILGASWAEYTDMAGEAARLADKVGGLQGYIRALQTKPAR